MRRSTLSTTVLLLLAACGGGGSGGDQDFIAPQPVVRLSPELDGAAWEVGEARVVRELAVPSDFGVEGPEVWTPSNESMRIVLRQSRSPDPFLHFEEDMREGHVRIRTDYEAGSFDRARLYMAGKGSWQMRLLAIRGGEEVASQVIEAFGLDESELQEWEIPFSELQTHTGTFSELVLHIPFAESGLNLTRIELVRDGVAVNLPSPEAAPVHVRAGGETRPSVGLLGGLALAAAVPDTGTGRLVVDAILTDQRPQSRGELTLTVVSEQGETLSATDFTLEHAWQDCAVPLDPLAKGPGLVRITARSTAADGQAGSQDEPLELLVANPRIEYPQAEPRTVVFMTSDTHRADHVGAMGETAPVRTPNLDRLADEGVLFTNCNAPTNITNPSHIALMTGLHPRDTRILDNRTALQSRAETLAEAFQAAGYRTFAVMSAFQLGDVTSGLGQGFDRMNSPRIYERTGNASVGIARSWLEEAADQSVFLWLHVFEAHSPYAPPEPFDRRYYEPGRDPRDPSRSLHMFPNKLPTWLQLMDVTDPDYLYAQYRAEIDCLDAELAAIFDLPRVRSGILAFTADHGEAFGPHDVWFDHQGIYPDTTHIPLIMRWPGGPEGLEVDRPVRSIDVGRTLLNLAELEDAPFPGSDLRTYLEPGDSEQTRYAISAHHASAMVERDGWVLVLYLRNRPQGASGSIHRTGKTELYNRNADPACVNDVLFENLELATELRALVIEWLAGSPSVGLGSAGSTDLEQEAALAAMGYLDSEDEAEEPRWWEPETRERWWATSPWRRLFEDPEYGEAEFRAEIGDYEAYEGKFKGRKPPR